MNKFNIIKPYKTLESKIDYENPYMKIRKDRVVLPDRREKNYYILERGDFAVSIPLTSNNKTYLVGQHRYPIKKFSLEFPMGYVPDKNPLDIARIELKQETGLKAKVWEKIGSAHLAPGHNWQAFHIFVAKNLIKGEPEFEEDEFIKIRPDVDIKKVREMILNGKITDGPTIVAYHFLEEYLRRSK